MPRSPVTLEDFTHECQTLGSDMTDNLTPCLEACAETEILGQIRDNFQTSQQADGQAWPPRKDPRPKHPLLILSGDLKTAATGGVRTVDKYTVEAGVMGAIPYAGVQQHGWPERNISARPYMNVNGDTADAIQERIADYIIEQIS